MTQELDKKDTETRKNNAILYGLPEAGTAMEDVLELMKKEIFMNFNKPVQAVRLNQRVSGKARPIELRFVDEKSKWEFLKY